MFLIASVHLSRKYRNYKKTKPTNYKDYPEDPTRDNNEDIDDSDDYEEEENDQDNNNRKQVYRKPWNESTVAAPVIDTDVQIGKMIIFCKYLFVPSAIQFK